MIGNVTTIEKKITMPTYLTAKPDKNPLFFEKRVYQGSSGKIYPHAMTEKILDEKVDVEYPSVTLENDYLKVVILPTLGGRIQRAYDKTNDYDFVYYNHVIKPALVGLIGPWISGGIEFNWPQHHRPSTYMPTEYEIVENEDGSKTVWVSEIDKMYGTKGMAGFTLYPDKAYIEITGKVNNLTDTPQTFLWWANPAVPANDHTASIFPPDVHAVMDHGKRAVSDFPITTGTYYKYDYSDGIDISRYKNIKVPTSYMAHHSDYDFIGNYDEEKKAGLLHVANHHVSPGKKQWVWGNSDFGLAWDRNLTDSDGPYVELMTGVFTDNQPDFTWLRPFEEKEFQQYFMPYKGVGRVKNATIDGAVNLEIDGDKLVYACYTTSKQENMTIVITHLDQVIFEKKLTLDPATYHEGELVSPQVEMNSDLKITLVSADNEIIVDYTGVEEKINELPDPAEALLEPEKLKTTEELFLAATHIEQYRHATLDAVDYYLEGLKRDPEDIRLNNGYGLHLYKRGLIAESLEHFNRAVKKQTWKSPNPYYGEPLFNQGLAQLRLGQVNLAVDSFFKATWNEDTQSSAFYQLATISAQRKKWEDVLKQVKQSLIRNGHQLKALQLQLATRRQLGKINDFTTVLEIDPLYLGFHFEQFLQDETYDWQRVMRGEINNYLELALDYLAWGMYEEAVIVLKHAPQNSPLAHYYTAFAQLNLKEVEAAKQSVRLGEAASTDYCFPNKLMEIPILNAVIDLLPEESGYAKYYLGNLFYDKKRYEEAIELWEQATKEIPEFPTVFRNLSMAYYNRHDDLEKAKEMIQIAFDLDPTDGRVLLEKDILAQISQTAIDIRLAELEKHIETTKDRDDLFVTYLSLLNNQKEFTKAYDLMMARQFHPWEGGEGKVSGQYLFNLIECARELMTTDPEKAIALLKQSQVYPENLGEGKLPNVQDNLSDYYIAKIYEAQGNSELAKEYYQKAALGTSEPESVLYYYDQPADSILYRGLAQEKLGNQKEARKWFHQLIRYGEINIFEEVNYDYFAVSMPETVVFKRNLTQENKIYCRYLMALGTIGLKNYEKATQMLTDIVKEVPDHQGALSHLWMLKSKTY